MKSSDVKYIVVHCSATQPKADIGAQEIGRWHREQGWLKIGYHFVIRRDGTVEIGRKLSEQGAHVGPEFNPKSIGICLIGGINTKGKAEDNFTAIQKTILRSKINELKAGDYKHAEVLGHRDLPNVKKDCPSFDVRAWW